MNPTSQRIEHCRQKKEHNDPTLEELDVLCRKCHHLHDEEILLKIGRLWKTIQRIFGAREVVQEKEV